LIVKVNPFDVPPPGVGFITVTDAVPAVAMSLAGTEAVNFVLLTYFVFSPFPFHCTVEVETKLVPFTVRVNAAPPAVALEGESEVAVGSGFLMVNVRAFDVPPPGVGFTTVTNAVPPVAMSLAGTEVVNFVPLTYFVVSPFPFHCTVEVETKFVPFTVRVNACPPAVALEGESEVAPGFGLLIVKVSALDVPPPGVGFITVTVAVPAVAMLLAGTEAVNFVSLTYFVVSPFPFHSTLEVETNFVPVTVRVNAAPPAVALEGESVLSAGTGLTPVPVRLTVCGVFEALSAKFSEALRLPVADGLNVTLTLQVPLGVSVAPMQVSALVAKSRAFVPPSVTVEMLRSPVPVLVTVTVWGALGLPTFCEPNVRLVGERATEKLTEVHLFTRLAAFTEPSPVAKSYPGVVVQAGVELSAGLTIIP
jgi:hypothetical protein